VNADSTITYTPNTNFNGADTFTYSICDGGTPNLCDTATVIITINAINDAPIANDDTNTTSEDTPVSGTVATNDTDVDGPSITIAEVTPPSNGTIVLNTDGTYTYTPNTNFNGADTMTYSYCDGGTPNLCDTAILVITINAINDAPVANDDNATTDEDTPTTINVLTNDSDTDNPLQVPTVITNPTNGTVTVNADSTITYTPNATSTEQTRSRIASVMAAHQTCVIQLRLSSRSMRSMMHRLLMMILTRPMKTPR
jgi:VCBS repeat-containing protein